MKTEGDLSESNYESNGLQMHHDARRENKLNKIFQERALNNSEQGRRDVKEKGVRKKEDCQFLTEK